MSDKVEIVSIEEYKPDWHKSKPIKSFVVFKNSVVSVVLHFFDTTDAGSSEKVRNTDYNIYGVNFLEHRRFLHCEVGLYYLAQIPGSSYKMFWVWDKTMRAVEIPGKYWGKTTVCESVDVDMQTELDQVVLKAITIAKQSEQEHLKADDLATRYKHIADGLSEEAVLFAGGLTEPRLLGRN
jgi:hypothetical protein